MSNTIIPGRDKDVALALSNNIAHMGGNLAALGITPEEATDLSARAATFSALVASTAVSKSAWVATSATKKAARKHLVAGYRGLVQRLHADPAVTDAQIVAAGIPSRDTVKSVLAPPIPLDLVVAPQATGSTDLAWFRNAADQSCDFLIEKKTAADPEYVLVGSTRTARFTHLGNKAGVATLYRVQCRRGKLVSQFCIPQGAYLV